MGCFRWLHDDRPRHFQCMASHGFGMQHVTTMSRSADGANSMSGLFSSKGHQFWQFLSCVGYCFIFLYFF
ncbi:unnamed protein product, partial [Prunus brigantina]